MRGLALTTLALATGIAQADARDRLYGRSAGTRDGSVFEAARRSRGCDENRAEPATLLG
jgi:hypothetical protein